MRELALMTLGMALVAAVALYADMTGNHGNIAARHIHHEFPECSNACHG